MAVRTIRVPVAEVVEGGSKSQFYADLRETLRHCRMIYNATVSHCVAIDRESFIYEEKIGKAPKFYTYPDLISTNKAFVGAKSEGSSLTRSAETKYRQLRFQVLRGNASAPIARSAPWPLLKKNITVRHSDGNTYVELRLLGGKRYTVRLRSGSNYRDQIKGIVNNPLGDSKIWISNRVATIGFSVDVPTRTEELVAGKVLTVSSTTKDIYALLLPRSERPYTFNVDHLIGQQTALRVRQQRCREQMKPKSKRQLRRRMAQMSRRFSRKLDDVVHVLSARIVGFAVRHRCSIVEYDDTIRCYFPAWRWHDFANKLAYKCEDRGIEFRHTAKPFEPCDDLSKPHFYARLLVDGNKVSAVKIGQTQDGRKRKTVGQSHLEEVTIAAIDCSEPKTRRALEKRFLAELQPHKKPGRQREVFDATQTVKWLRERGVLNETLGGSRASELLSTLNA